MIAAKRPTTTKTITTPASSTGKEPEPPSHCASRQQVLAHSPHSQDPLSPQQPAQILSQQSLMQIAQLRSQQTPQVIPRPCEWSGLRGPSRKPPASPCPCPD